MTEGVAAIAAQPEPEPEPERGQGPERQPEPDHGPGHDRDSAKPSARPHTSSPRLPGLDVTRAVALIGVVVMNYHGYLNGGAAPRNASFAERVFDTQQGPLTTRFAATFVLVAGMGVTLLTERSRRSADAASIVADRWRLFRRGFFLYTFGLLIEWIWPGTILFFYGAFFMVAALIFTLRIRWLLLIGTAAAVAAAGIAWFRVDRLIDHNDSTPWLDPPVNSPRNLLIRTFVSYTHPLLPWLAFLCAGIILGRYLHDFDRLRGRVLIGGGALFVGAYLVNFIGLRVATDSFQRDDGSTIRWRRLLSTSPFDRGLLYTMTTLGSSIVAYCVISWIADRYSTGALTQLLSHAGQMTLTLYVLHVLVFNAVVHWWHWVTPTGLDTALVFSLVFWVLAIAIGGWWHRFVGMGPLERFYRGFGG